MSSQHFDKKIADRLNSISVEPDARAWERISSRLPAPWWVLILRKYGPMAYVLTSVGLLAGLWFDHQNLKLNHTQTKKVYAQLQSQYDNLYAEVAILKTYAKSSVASSYQTEPEPVDGAPARRQGQEFGNSLAGVMPGIGAEKSAKSTKNKSLQDGDGLNKGVAAGSSSIPNRDLKLKASDRSNGLAKAYSEKYDHNVQGKETESFSNAGRDEILMPTTGNDSIVALSPNQTDSLKAEKILVKTASIPDSSQLVQASDKHRSKKILDRLMPRIGGEFISNFKELVGFGASLEFPVGNNVGFSLGILGYQQVSTDFGDELKFNAQTKKQFRNEYEYQLKSYPENISEITLKTSLMEVPIRLKYYWPVTPSISVVGSLGTHLNMSIRQDIRYETHENNKENYHSFIHRPAPEIFHNIVFAPGIQYQKQNLFLQVSPYYQFNYSQIEYLDHPQIFGLSTSLWIKF